MSTSGTRRASGLASDSGRTDSTGIGTPRFGPARSDVALAIGIAVLGVVGAAVETAGQLTAWGVLLPTIGGLALLQRRRSPYPVAAAILLSRWLLAVTDACEFAMAPAALVALFSLSRHRHSSRWFPIAPVVAIITFASATAYAYFDSNGFLGELAGELALMLAALAIGDAMRSRSEQVEQRIDTEAQARVKDERLRIARDLHDVVAHGLSTISVQSGVAGHLLDSDPENARQALAAINATGKKTLEELRSMVGVLRSTDEVSLRPTPVDPDDLAELISAADQAGLRVITDTTGAFPPEVSDACIVALHRIVQEALTNVVRHAGPVRVELSVRHTATMVQCRIMNDAGTGQQAVASTGVGIIGMTERAHSVDGTLHAGPGPNGGFVVLADLPYWRST